MSIPGQARALMIQGTGSNVGKSLLVAGLCRVARRRGLVVLPFKPQNMSNNAAVTEDGGEIGRAQALQALACGALPHSDMNPVLLKPETDTGAQVVVQGKRLTSVRARDYASLKPKIAEAVQESFRRLKARADLVIVEGAGSPAEVNLRQNDIANMGFALAADVPVVLAGDIDRGGVIAQIVGTKAVLDAADNAQIAGFLVGFSALAVEIAWSPPIWLHLIIWLPLVAVLAVALMRPGKGLMTALQMLRQRGADSHRETR